MACEWPMVTIEDIAERVAMGPFGSSIKVDTFVTDGVPVISGQHLHTSKVNDEIAFNFITEEHATRLNKANVQPGDVIFTHAGNIGQVAFIPRNSKYKRYVISQRQFYLRCDPTRAIPEYVVAFFKSPEGQHKLLANASQVGVPSIARPVSYLRTIEIPLPSVEVQKQIAHILGTLDDKIDLNRRMAATLEEMARAIFKSWFIDFDPVRAKAEGRPTNLPPEIDVLFPDSFEEDAVGNRPTGWRRGQLADVTGFQGGYAFKSKDWVEQGIPVVKIGSVKPGLVDLNSVSCVTEEVAAEAARFRLTPGDLLIGMTGYVGEVGLVPITDNPPLLNQRVGKFVQDKPGTSSIAYIYCLTRDADFKAQVESKSHGTAQANVSADGIQSVPIVVPPKALRDLFNVLVRPIIDRILDAHAVSNTLTITRDTLLPKLISGEIVIRSEGV